MRWTTEASPTVGGDCYLLEDGVFVGVLLRPELGSVIAEMLNELEP